LLYRLENLGANLTKEDLEPIYQKFLAIADENDVVNDDMLKQLLNDEMVNA
jgi:isopropylmalate/homocitrate/citramalate synthase